MVRTSERQPSSMIRWMPSVNQRRTRLTDIIEPDTLDFEGWCIYFEITDTLAYEVMFVYDQEKDIKTLKPVKAITWDGSDIDHVAITDVQAVCVTIH